MDTEQVVKAQGCWGRAHVYSGHKLSSASRGGWVKTNANTCH